MFDSGLGGLSVAAQIARKLPSERIIYLADNAHVPYGERPLEEIRGFALDIVGFLIDMGAKAVVMACNMSSAAALDAARERYAGTPVLGVIEPGARAAVRNERQAVAGGESGERSAIGVLATTGTVKSEAYVRSLEKLDPSLRVVQQACPKFVPLVESGRADSEEAEVAARACVAPLLSAGCGTIVLGCTHYPFLRAAIEAAAGPGVNIVDPAKETADELSNILLERGMASDLLVEPHEFYTTGETEGFAELGGAFLGMPIEGVKQAVWGVDLGLPLSDLAV